jgi:hypothetical protein
MPNDHRHSHSIISRHSNPLRGVKFFDKPYSQYRQKCRQSNFSLTAMVRDR